MPPSRQTALAATLLALSAVTAVVLADVLATVVLAVTLGYVLLPVRNEAVARGAPRRVAAGVATALASLIVVGFVAPVAFVLYERRAAAVALFESLPDVLPVTVGEVTYEIPVEPLIALARETLTGVAIEVAAVAPVIALKATVLVLLLYGLLYRPDALRTAAVRAVPRAYHEPLFALHRRAGETLRAIYVLQAATAVGTFLLGTGTFWALGYDSPVVLGVLSAVLQFVPILGPSVVVVVLAGLEVLAGDLTGAILVTVFGLVIVGFLPDAVIRTRLAEYTTELPVSLYFVGFVGGVLTVGAVGFVLGPLVVALLVETVLLLSDGVERAQRRLDDTPDGERSAGRGSAAGGAVGEESVASGTAVEESAPGATVPPDPADEDPPRGSTSPATGTGGHTAGDDGDGSES
ncbi:AI-2E family transporter [Halobaculum sp. MBLA0147]|uniref:AI-2E family transporter n=1 Tax=Halobaculum sp. MBLA0147 TaxID=3079934 RepID=UPI003525D39B